MLTSKRFRALLDSYGADIGRWPDEEHRQALKLLAVSPEARTWLEQARCLDEAIMSASHGENAMAWPAGEQDVALARLRLGVGAEIARKQVVREGHTVRAFQDRLSFIPRRWLGMAAGGGFAAAMGLLIGLTYAAGPGPVSGTETDTVLAMLQPAPMSVVADFDGGIDESEKD